jgi:solute carrier family 13 (sodium-dependent dicarboxylate transporter), member 2/3/5
MIPVNPVRPVWRALRRRSIHDDLAYWLRRMGQLRRPPVEVRPLLWFLASVVAAVGTAAALLSAGLPREAAYMGGIFALAGLLWVTEALPLFATALLVIGLEVVLIANPGGWAGLGFEDGASPTYQTFLAPLSDPIIWLFLGGFLIASAAVKEGVDQVLAGIVLHPFRGSPRRVMLGLMLVTAAFSMFMSNTATTAMMMTLVGPVLVQIPRGDPSRRGLLLSIPFAANIGGMGTPIASPPNAVAVGFLQQAGVEVSFLGWMLVAVPLAAGLLMATWLLLSSQYRPEAQGVQLEAGGGHLDVRGIYVLAVIGITILLWLTDVLHGLPAAVVALLPVIAFTAPGILGRQDFNTLEWHILILIAGGIALGVGMQVTGLDRAVVAAVPTATLFVLAPLVVATVLLSTFMSNTAAANLLLPVGIALAASGEGPGVLEAGVAIALAASVAMALPVSTPPNAIAFAHGELEARDLAISGGMVGALAVVLIVLFGGPIIRFWLGG